jgi:hypothetical protein
MTTPERKIQETEGLLSVDRVQPDQKLLRQILSNQLTLLRAVKVQLNWGDE